MPSQTSMACSSPGFSCFGVVPQVLLQGQIPVNFLHGRSLLVEQKCHQENQRAASLMPGPFLGCNAARTWASSFPSLPAAHLLPSPPLSLCCSLPWGLEEPSLTLPARTARSAHPLCPGSPTHDEHLQSPGLKEEHK